MDDTFQVKKWEAYFNKLDTNGDGLVTLEEVIALCEKIASSAGVPLTEDIRQSWVEMFHTSADNNQVTFEELKMKLRKLDENESRIEMMANMSKPMFRAIDTNDDGKLSLKEYKAYTTHFGVSEEDAAVGFEALDENSDGFISHEEFAVARAHYFFDKEDTKYKHFFGQFKE